MWKREHRLGTCHLHQEPDTTNWTPPSPGSSCAHPHLPSHYSAAGPENTRKNLEFSLPCSKIHDPNCVQLGLLTLYKSGSSFNSMFPRSTILLCGPFIFTSVFHCGLHTSSLINHVPKRQLETVVARQCSHIQKHKTHKIMFPNSLYAWQTFPKSNVVKLYLILTFISTLLYWPFKLSLLWHTYSHLLPRVQFPYRHVEFWLCHPGY